MEYIEGQTLGSCWDSMTLPSKLRVAWILCNYITLLRRLRRTVPGTLNDAVWVQDHFSPLTVRAHSLVMTI